MLKSPVLVITEKKHYPFYRNLNLKFAEVFVYHLLDAFNVLEERTAEIVIIDCGDDVQRALRLLLTFRNRHPAKPVLFVSNQNSEDLVLSAYKLGVREYIKRPININEFRNCIEKLLYVTNIIQEKRTPYSSVSHTNDTEDDTTALPSNIFHSIHYIKEHISENINLSQLAEEANLSKYHFCRVFKSCVGKSPLQYVIEAKITKAKDLLKHPDHNISFVAFEIGFNDVSSFVKHFKRIAGVTPSSYKKNIMH